MNPLRRTSTALAVVCLLTAGLAACGSDSETKATGSVEVSGAFGELPEVTYETPYVVTKTEVEVLTEGDGDVVESGDAAFVNIYIGNGHNGEPAMSTWVLPEQPAEEPDEVPTDDATEAPAQNDDDARRERRKERRERRKAEQQGDTESTHAAEEVEATPEMIRFTSGESVPALEKAVIGHKVGSRVLVSAPGKDAYSYGGAEFGIGNEDTTVFVVDIVRKVRPAVDTSAAQEPRRGLPKVVETDGKVSGIDFSDARRRAGDRLLVETLVEGDGPAIAKGSLVALRYYGSVWGRKKNFDDNWSDDLPGFNGRPLTAGVGQVIQGWDKGLDGLKEGTRVMLVIPSEMAYGEEGQGKDIPGDSDLVFVVDVLGVV